MTLDMSTRILVRRRPELAGGEKASLADLAVGPELSPGMDVFVNVRIDRRLREMLDCDVLGCM